MILQRQRSFVRAGLVGRALAVGGGAREFDVVLHENAVVEDGDAGGTKQFARVSKRGPWKTMS